MENPHDGEQTFFCVLDMNTPDIHFNLQNTTFYYVCLSWFVLKMSCLLCTFENKHWFTIIKSIISNNYFNFRCDYKASYKYYRMVTWHWKMSIVGGWWGWQLRLIFNRLYSLLLNHLPPSDHNFIGLRFVYCRKRKGQWFSHVTKEVGKRRVVNDQSPGLTKSD